MPIVDVQDKGRLIRKRAEGVEMVNLYDPPVDGATPLNGAGEPRTSVIPKRDVEPKLAQGCTLEPLVPAPKITKTIMGDSGERNIAPPPEPKKRARSKR